MSVIRGLIFGEAYIRGGLTFGILRYSASNVQPREMPLMSASSALINSILFVRITVSKSLKDFPIFLLMLITTN